MHEAMAEAAAGAQDDPLAALAAQGRAYVALRPVATGALPADVHAPSGS